MKRIGNRHRLVGTLFLALSVLLGLAFLAAALASASCFYTAWHARKIWPWLVSEVEPDAMHTLEDVQFKWVLGGVVYLFHGLCALAGGIVLVYQGRKRRREGKA